MSDLLEDTSSDENVIFKKDTTNDPDALDAERPDFGRRTRSGIVGDTMDPSLEASMEKIPRTRKTPWMPSFRSTNSSSAAVNPGHDMNRNVFESSFVENNSRKNSQMRTSQDLSARPGSLPTVRPPKGAPLYMRVGSSFVQIQGNPRQGRCTSPLARYTMRQKLILIAGSVMLIAGVVCFYAGFLLLAPNLVIKNVAPPPSPSKIQRTFYPTANPAPVSLISLVPITSPPTIQFDTQLARIRLELIEAFNNKAFTKEGPPLSLEVFFDMNSPQYKALEWISLQDRYFLPIGRGGTDIAHRWLICVFYYHFQGEDWHRKENWLTNTHECTWEGITCKDVVEDVSTSVTSRRMSEMNLNGNRLVGSLPFEITYLVHLERLSMNRNVIFGFIPTEIGRLFELKFLDLQLNNGIVGNLPFELTTLANLQEIHMNNCSLAGTIPPEMESLQLLEVLNLNTNNFMGFLPESLGNLLNLKKLMLGDNAFFGKIPVQYGNLVNLETLELWSNTLDSGIPDSLAFLENLSKLFDNVL